jgi:serine/threonine-protein kinase
VQIGRYRVVGELGKGAMGIVYKAQDPAIGRTVAIKTIRLSDLTEPSERERLRDRLFREAQSAGILSHPNIVTIYDMLEQDGMAYIFMEFVNGPALERLLTNDQAPLRETLLGIFAQTAAALDYAHRKGIVHRDIKPANIMIDDDGAAKITDFGVAKIVSQQMTQAGSMMGTPSYMSPEQIQGQPVDGRADQFALAVIAYEVLTGEKPFTGEYTPTLLYKICREDPVPAPQLNPTLGPEVDGVLQRALAKSPAQRYPTCSEFVAVLQKALAATPSWKPLTRGTSLHMETIAGAAGANRVAPPVAAAPARREESESHLVRNTVLAAIAFVAVGIVFLLAQRWASPTSAPTTSAQASESPPAIQSAETDTQKPSALVKPDEPKPTPAQPAETADPDSAPPDKPDSEGKATPRPRVAAPAQPVMAEFNSVPPGAKIILDNNPALSCDAPCSIALEPGRHVVRAMRDGYRSASRIMMTPADTKLTIAMEQMAGTLSVTSNPPGASILINGQVRPEKTPAVIRLPPGAYRLQVKIGKVETEEETVEIRDSGISQRMYSLQ